MYNLLEGVHLLCGNRHALAERDMLLLALWYGLCLLIITGFFLPRSLLIATMLRRELPPVITKCVACSAIFHLEEIRFWPRHQRFSVGLLTIHT